MPGMDGRTLSDLLSVLEPATEAVLEQIPRAGLDEVDAAVSRAREAYPAWRALAPAARAGYLRDLAGALEQRLESLAVLEARNAGKPIGDARAEMAMVVDTFRYYAGAPERLLGDTIPVAGGQAWTVREPLGVVGLITPWNFPIAIPAWKIAPALAYGNCIVMKPAELVPGSSWALADIIQRAGFPAGVFNLVVGRGSVVGEKLVTDPRIDAISFTGSVPTGRGILAKAASRGAKVQLEMGGKNPLVVLADADLDVAVRVALDGAFFQTGQRCTASSRLIVEEAIHDKFVAGLAEALKKQVIDDARKPGTTIGPVVDQSQLDQDITYIDIAKSEGGKLVVGGERLNREKSGFYLSPALFSETTNNMRINREEVFGPVASVVRVKDYDEALSVANDTQFGLCAGVVTTSLKKAAHFRRNAEAGMVMVNLPTAGVDYHVPFGGRKGSSYGSREQGRYAVEFYTQVKTAYLMQS